MYNDKDMQYGDEQQDYPRERGRYRDDTRYYNNEQSDRSYRHRNSSRGQRDPYSRRGQYQENRSRSPSRGQHSRPSHSHERRGGGYRDRDAPPNDYRSRSPDERFVSRDILIDGLGVNITEDDIMKELNALQLNGLEKVTLIRDRKTGESRGFAFIHFSTTEDSTALVDNYGSAIKIDGDRCRLSFSKERDDHDRRRRREEGEDWRCRVCLLVNYPRREECFRCQAPRTDVTLTGGLTHPTPTHFTNDGERDAATEPPSQFLLFRDLETSVTEEMLSKGVLKLSTAFDANGADEGSLSRILLIRDRRSHESWRFGFAEFSTPQEAQKALKVYEKAAKFTISSKPVTVSYIHAGVFVPVFNAAPEAEQYTFYGGANGSVLLAYWDEEGYASEFRFPEKDKKKGKKRASPPVVAEEGFKDEKKTKKRKLDENSAKKPAALPSHLQFWQNRHSELHGIKKPKQQEGAAEGDDAAQSVGDKAPATAQATESFANLTRMCCLLCSRQFKAVDKLHEHERVSKLHATNLKNATLVETARKKLVKAAPEYRDRAAERREVFGKEQKPTPNKKGESKAKEKEKDDDKPIASKGAALLGKMGWTAGQGLGAGGDGRTEHIVAEVFQQGVGLGHESAKKGDVEEQAKTGSGSYQEFVRKTRENAKARFESFKKE